MMVKMLRGDLKGRLLNYSAEDAAQLVADGYAEYPDGPDPHQIYKTRDMAPEAKPAGKKRGRLAKGDGESGEADPDGD